MRIATLSIGDELMTGQVTDTNASFIAAALVEHGLRVKRHAAVGDSEPDIAGALDTLSSGSDVLIVTGGLGPTEDDMTSGAAARAFGRPLVMNREAQEHIRTILAELNLLYSSPPGDKQALVPEHAVLIANPIGTASGFYLTHRDCTVFFLPGVPPEMSRMLHASVIPLILEHAGPGTAIESARFDLFGPAEADVDELLKGIARPEQGLYLGICVTFPRIRVTLRAEARSGEAAALLGPAVREVRERLKEWIFSDSGATMDEAVAALFRASGLTLALAESCTGGMIARRITEIPGSSAYFSEGVVTYSNTAKMRLLGVSAEILDNFGAVSSECAEAMARGIRQAAGSYLGLAVTGIAGPDGGSAEKPVGTVFIALAAPDGCRVERFRFYGSRGAIRVLTAWTALDWLRRYLLEQVQRS